MSQHRIPFTQDQVSVKGASILVIIGVVADRFLVPIIAKVGGTAAGFILGQKAKADFKRHMATAAANTMNQVG